MSHADFDPKKIATAIGVGALVTAAGISAVRGARGNVLTLDNVVWNSCFEFGFAAAAFLTSPVWVTCLVANGCGRIAQKVQSRFAGGGDAEALLNPTQELP